MNRVWQRPRYGLRSRRASFMDVTIFLVVLATLIVVPWIVIVELTLAVLEGH